jgi:hypothetical protein
MAVMGEARMDILRREREALLAENARLRKSIEMAGQDIMAPTPEPVAAPTPRSAKQFAKTKMCKFHILNLCSKGTQCPFAHNKAELSPLPDLSCTKLCKTLLKTGRCDIPGCKYAHSGSELRPTEEPQSICEVSASVEQSCEQKEPMKVLLGTTFDMVPSSVLGEATGVVDRSPTLLTSSSLASGKIPCNELVLPPPLRLPLPFNSHVQNENIFVDQREGVVKIAREELSVLKIAREELSSCFPDRMDDCKTLRTVRTSQSTLCSLADNF